MKMTVLQMTQNILSSLDSDAVNSISDTVESDQVSQILRTTYFNILPRARLEKHRQLFQLTASGDTSLPVLMYKPDTISSVEWIKYYNTDADGDGDADSDDSPLYQYVTILPVQQFLDITNNFDTVNDTTVDTFTLDSFTFNYKDDTQPTYCTVIKNYNIIFDSFNGDIDSTLQTSKTQCYGQVIPTFTLSDSFTPDLDDELFPLLLNEAKSLAFLELKQMQHPKADQETRRQWSNLQKDKSLANKPSHFDQLPYFGRK